jgi:hypothetical protein
MSVRSPFAAADPQSMTAWCEHFGLPDAVRDKLVNELRVTQVKFLRDVYETPEHLATIKKLCKPTEFTQFLKGRDATAGMPNTRAEQLTIHRPTASAPSASSAAPATSRSPIAPRRLSSLAGGAGPAILDAADDSSDDYSDKNELDVNAFYVQSNPSKKMGRPKGAEEITWGPVVHTVLRSKFPTDAMARKEALRLKNFPRASTEHEWIRKGK